MFKKQGFTLVELMIVVAIIGILAAIAIPNFVAMQLKAKRAEVPSNVDGIKTAELAYDASNDGFVSAADYPGTASVGKAQLAWTAASSGGFKTIGWEPDGKVRGSYSVSLTGNTDFTVTGICDVDGDGSKATYTASKTVNAALSGTDQNVY